MSSKATKPKLLNLPEPLISPRSKIAQVSLNPSICSTTAAELVNFKSSRLFINCSPFCFLELNSSIYVLFSSQNISISYILFFFLIPFALPGLKALMFSRGISIYSSSKKFLSSKKRMSLFSYKAKYLFSIPN